MLNGKIRNNNVFPQDRSPLLKGLLEYMFFLYMNYPLTIYKSWDYQFYGEGEGFSLKINVVN